MRTHLHRHKLPENIESCISNVDFVCEISTDDKHENMQWNEVDAKDFLINVIL